MIELKAAKRALRKANGSVRIAARRLKVPSRELRAFVKANKKLMDDVMESVERDLDKAERIIIEALDDPNPGNRIRAAALILKGRFMKPLTRDSVKARPPDTEPQP